MNVVRFLSATALAGAALAVPSFALAQTGTTPTAQECRDDPKLANCPRENADGSESSGSTIVVTGSRIARPTLTSSVPVTSVTAEDLLSQGDLNVGDALNDLPSLRGTFSQSNSTRSIGTAGLNFLDLRGLGIARTLVLVNGRRHVTALAGDYFVDTNTIPVSLLERTDIVTGGNSAVYGSDAIGGVVNFILKRNFDGIRVTGQAGISSRGDRGLTNLTGTFGRNFADGRGNIAISLDYLRFQEVSLTNRDYLTGAFSGRNQFNTIEPTAGEPFGTDGIIDQRFTNGIRNNNISDGGLLLGVCNATLIANPARCTPGSSATNFFGTAYVFTPDGQLIANPVTNDLRVQTNGATNNAIGGLGSTLTNYGTLFPGYENFSANLLGRFEVSPAFVPFIEAKYARVRSAYDSPSGPSFFQGSIPGFFGGGSNLRCDNPFLTAQAYAQLQTIGRCSTTIAYGATNATAFTISRNNVDLGIRSEVNTRDTFRVVGGIEGRFNDDWRYELAVNYGSLVSTTVSKNNLLLFKPDGSNAGFLNSLDAARNGAGQIVCRINAVTVTDAACVPFNPFGQNSTPNLQAVRNYVNVDSLYRQTASQFVVSGFVGGDLSQLFELPGGPIAFAVGAEYREERAAAFADENTEQGLTFLTALTSVNYPKLTVKDIYGEIRIPIVRDKPFFNVLEVNGAYRLSDYNNSTGTTRSYNASVFYSPVTGLSFRAAYARAVRAPTQSDLFDPIGQNFASISDPCDVQFISNGPNRAANCAAAGVPVGFVNTPARSATLSFSQGGNPFLTAERSDSYTLGAVFEPSFVPGLSVTVDYYNIKVKNLIATLGAQTIINLCYDSPTITNQYCPLVTRLANSEFGPRAVLSGPVNFAAQRARGIDIDMAYSKKFENGDRFTYRVIGSKKLTIDNFVDPTNPLIPNRQLSELGDPEYEFFASASYKRGPLQGTLAVRYIGPQTISTYEAQNPYQGLCPASGITGYTGRTCTAGSITTLDAQNNDLTAEVWYPSLVYTNLRLDLDVTTKFRLSVGMDNIFDVKPPFGSQGIGAGSSIFDTTGRYMYAAFRANF
jgi:outer membrane receptor protein involved in Fe transport